MSALSAPSPTIVLPIERAEKCGGGQDGTGDLGIMLRSWNDRLQAELSSACAQELATEVETALLAAVFRGRNREGAKQVLRKAAKLVCRAQLRTASSIAEPTSQVRGDSEHPIGELACIPETGIASFATYEPSTESNQLLKDEDPGARSFPFSSKKAYPPWRLGASPIQMVTTTTPIWLPSCGWSLSKI